MSRDTRLHVKRKKRKGIKRNGCTCGRIEDGAKEGRQPTLVERCKNCSVGLSSISVECHNIQIDAGGFVLKER